MTTQSESGRSEPTPTEPIKAETRKLLEAARNELLRLHKAILEAERAAYELDHGRVESPHALLHLVMHDPWFGWFRPLSEMAVQIDELLDPNPFGAALRRGAPTAQPAEATEAAAQDILRELRSLLTPSESGEEFATKYHAMLQQDPTVIMSHSKLSQLLQI